MFWTKEELKDIPYEFLHDAVYCISRIFPVLSVYMDSKGGLAIKIDKDLERHEIQDCLFNLHYYGPYAAAPEGPSAESACLGHDFNWTQDGKTMIFSHDGVDYRHLENILGASY